VRADDPLGQLWLSDYLTPSHRIMHAVRGVLVNRKTSFQHLQIVDTVDFGKALVLDGAWQSATVDEFIYHESLVHPAMLACGAPRNVLILGGGEGGTSREVLRWRSVERVVMVDIDGDVVDACREHLPEMHQGAFDDPRHELVIGDALTYLESTTTRWDVVISDLSDPVDDGPSFRLFTREHFKRIAGVLSDGGAFVVQAGPVSPADMTIHARLVHTVGSVFAQANSYQAYVPSFGVPWGFCLASDGAAQSSLDPVAAEKTLRAQVQGELRYLDGAMMAAQRRLPPYLHAAIRAQTEPYTQDEPPRFGAKR